MGRQVKIKAKKTYNKTRVLVSLESEIVDLVKIYCKKHKLTFSFVVNELLFDYIKIKDTK
jgi:hypothetical protein